MQNLLEKQEKGKKST